MIRKFLILCAFFSGVIYSMESDVHEESRRCSLYKKYTRYAYQVSVSGALIVTGVMFDSLGCLGLGCLTGSLLVTELQYNYQKLNIERDLRFTRQLFDQSMRLNQNRARNIALLQQ